MELISKISKGSKMDQIYIPKIRNGFFTGSYVLIKSINTQELNNETQIKPKKSQPYFYNISSLEPIKLEIIKKIIEIIDSKTKSKNIIITGSFLKKGFNFNDIDILIINESKEDTKQNKENPEQIKEIHKIIENTLGIKPHILTLDNKSLIRGLCTDPLYQMMLSQYISKNRIIYNIKNELNYKLLDLQLLKSKSLMDNWDILNGNEKYYLTRNMLSISLFLKNKKINENELKKEIKQSLNTTTEKIKQNLLEKTSFLKDYKKTYDVLFNKIMRGIKNGSK
ncbi:MAG: nucleotidyltransferase domain-containing protein [Nanoarchaeota archaeon]